LKQIKEAQEKEKEMAEARKAEDLSKREEVSKVAQPPASTTSKSAGKEKKGPQKQQNDSPRVDKSEEQQPKVVESKENKDEEDEFDDLSGFDFETFEGADSVVDKSKVKVQPSTKAAEQEEKKS